MKINEFPTHKAPNITVAIDSFKGSLSTIEAGNAVKEGILQAYPNATVTVCPLADGGEGTVNAIVSMTGGKLCKLAVTDPLGATVEAEYGFIPESGTAVIEMASAAGITLVPEDKRNPLFTTTYGVGEIITHAIRKLGCRNFIIGIGGSATNDGGVGMLQALGFEFFDSDGNPTPHGAIGLSTLAKIETENALPELSECTFRIACDVKNPLCGENGCSAVYGPQKGATPDMIRNMDGWLKKYAELTAKTLGQSNEGFPGAGAAGGMGFAFISYLRGSLVSGIELVIEATGLEKHVAASDIVVTGEGRLDAQTCMGKAPVGVAKTAKKYGKPVIAFAGCVTDGATECNNHGIDAFFPILRAPCTLAEAMDTENAYNNLKNTAEQAFRLIKTFNNVVG